MNIIIENNQDKIPLNQEYNKILETSISATLLLLKIPFECEIYISLIDNTTIQEVNNEQRDIDKATDVLSFPMTNMLNGDSSSIDPTIDITDGILLLGDILISLEKVSSQAQEYGHSFQRELAFLAVHGTLHLLGFDHQSKSEEKIMFELQEKILAKINMFREI